MDFLLYLIQRKNLDILEVNLIEITDQYIAYIEMMEDFEYELAGDYLAMAAYLAESNQESYYHEKKKMKRKRGIQKQNCLEDCKNIKDLKKYLLS